MSHLEKELTLYGAMLFIEFNNVQFQGSWKPNEDTIVQYSIVFLKFDIVNKGLA